MPTSEESTPVTTSLVIFKPDGSRMDIPLKVGTYLVGRHPDCRLRIPLPNVSRRHCELLIADTGLEVRDLGSSNGTFCNNERINAGALTKLAAGDVLGVGTCLLTVQINGQPEITSAPQVDKPAAPDDSDMQSGVDMTPPAAAPAATVDDDLDETIAKGPGLQSLLGDADDSSVFDFDFDFEDENPKL